MARQGSPGMARTRAKVTKTIPISTGMIDTKRPSRKRPIDILPPQPYYDFPCIADQRQQRRAAQAKQIMNGWGVWRPTQVYTLRWLLSFGREQPGRLYYSSAGGAFKKAEKR